VPAPPSVIGRWEIDPHVYAAGFLAGQRRGDQDPPCDQHVLQFPTVGRGELSRQNIPAPMVDPLGSFRQCALLPSNTCRTPLDTTLGFVYFRVFEV
jgi:hypothetical protein